ncbi:metal ABC transporter solute-binding protein, Zn/Mn family [Nostoc sphaeroides]|uniref:ABC.MN.S, manganese/iron transport system substrate-binding protein n=1 Tax=Nostoc sphaeroides CCNUC1 TaxID=2653204 RepID=A0A5P8WHE2_9NOSO|nr:zinc ABC transporter substrate-binding protein [Nostoc sphaeroides]QFS51249.1 ABC.MN.S, manganese/iron transport system substrate-binding protein [Nostoc sphaeroides CCNUC1]
MISYKLRLKSLAALALTCGVFGCSPTSQTSQSTPTPGDNASVIQTGTSPAPEASSKPLVVATNTIACGLTKEIAGDTIDLKCLIDPGSDPHVYQPKPEDSKAIEQAKLILYGGYDFEPGLIKLIKATSNSAPKVAVNEVAVPQPQQFDEDGKTVTDPHVWQNAQNGIAIAQTISQELAKVVPNNAATYTSNTQKLTNEISQIDTWIKSEIATIPPKQRKLVTTHDAFGYYSKAYGIPVEGALGGISTEEAPTAARVGALSKDIKKEGVPTIFAETTINPRLITAVAKEAKVKVAKEELFADGLGEKGTEGETYQGMLIANTRTIVEGLGGKYTEFKPK